MSDTDIPSHSYPERIEGQVHAHRPPAHPAHPRQASVTAPDLSWRGLDQQGVRR